MSVYARTYAHYYICIIPPQYRKGRPEIIQETESLQGVGMRGIRDGVNRPSVHFLNRFDFWN